MESVRTEREHTMKSECGYVWLALSLRELFGSAIKCTAFRPKLKHPVANRQHHKALTPLLRPCDWRMHPS